MSANILSPAGKHAHPILHKRLVLALILILAAVLRFYQLDHSSLWSDEGNTWALLGRSFTQIAQDAAADIHPPGYYWLLKVWSMIVGNDAWGMRSFSALAGVLLVYVIYQLSCTLETNPNLAGVGLLAAFLAALNPFQIYYSQEARMYMLLALESAGLFWALFAWQNQNKRNRIFPVLGYLLCGIGGLWTHYSFPIVLAAAVAGSLLTQAAPMFQGKRPIHGAAHALFGERRFFWYFLALNLLIGLAYLPWLPTALDRVYHWPKGGVVVAPVDGLKLTMHMLVFGPLRALPAVQWPWLLAAAVLPLFGLGRQWRQVRYWPILLWLFAPLLLMFGLGLFSDAFLKFLLIASPAWCLLSAVGIRRLPKSRFWLPLFVLGALTVALRSLPAYYTSATARDNYAGIAQYLQAAAPPDQTLVVLDAPGQQEVWRYYEQTYHLGLSTLALPQQRPPDQATTIATLNAAVADRRTIYALFWATHEADPDQLVERWLDQQAFKGLDSWQGNLRFVTYTRPTALSCTAVAPHYRFGAAIILTELCQPNRPQNVAAGEVALVGLHWQTMAPLAQRYKVTVQVLDSRHGVIAQRDSEPVGGSFPTDQWPVGQTIVDNHGILLPAGTAPGSYQLILALYDGATGERLQLDGGADHGALGEIVVVRPQRPLPVALLPAQHSINRLLGPLRLVGYSAHGKGMGHAPDTPIMAGELVEFTFFWQAPDPLPADWPSDLNFSLMLGRQSILLPLGGGNYPPSQWQAGEVVRSKAELLYTGEDPIPHLVIAHSRTKLPALPGASWWQVIVGYQ